MNTDEMLGILKKGMTHLREMHSEVITPEAEDAAFLKNMPKPEKKLPEGQNKLHRLREALVQATQKTKGINPKVKKASWKEAFEFLAKIGKG
jgi:hypothetical protein